ncbi:MAG: hypothetical protein ABIR96_12290 [Bdellovibrionota bacterium]
MLCRTILTLSVLSVSLLSAAHSLEGCWEGQGFITLPPFGRAACTRIAVKHEFTAGNFVMRAIAMDCPNFSPGWESKNFEIHNGNEIWGAQEGQEKRIIGWLEDNTYAFDEPVSILHFIEYSAERNPQTGRVRWVESFTGNQKLYWKVEGDLAPVTCEGIAP